MAVTPTERLVSSREKLQRDFDVFREAAGPGEVFGYEARLAKWLAEQLAGADLGELGWAIILVSAMLYPNNPPTPAEDRFQQGGQRFSYLLASRVGEALLAEPSAAESDGSALVVGPKLASRDLSEIYSEMTGLPSSLVPGTDPAVLRREFQQKWRDGVAEIRQALVTELPGADLRAIGWALLGTGTSLLTRTLQIRPPRWRPGGRTRKRTRTSAFSNSLLLAAIGDYLINPPS